MFGRKQMQMQTHRQKFVSELGESVHALRRAAGHAAQGTSERFTPTYDRARNMAGQRWESTRQTVSPKLQQMRENAMSQRAMSPRAMRRRKKEAQKRSRMRTLRGLLITGAAVGAASAAVARRRRQQAEWAEYQPTGFDESQYAESKYGPQSARQKVTTGAATMADSFSARAGRIADSLHERSAGMQERAGEMGGQQRESMGREQSAQGMTGPGPMGRPGSAMGVSTSQQSLSSPRERLGDPALDFPDEH
ncbi:MAG TPA: hypothetical protein VFY84_11630 [Jiangellales bacterium]|nr:hypothetical protein [Jiangellales bacterium]